ncbi:MAG: T9SS type A sorting domain-containing protein [Bacteroidetes bacterium]|nr:T9SS type A sorting domain-containing protein [Bacteroidota bacterium]
MRKEIQLQNYVQCPSSGGPSVHWARILVSLLNDTIVYNDGDVCATMGIFKQVKTNNGESATNLICFPNPSSTSIQLLFNGLNGLEYTLEIHDRSGKLVLSKKFNSASGMYYLNTSSLSNGLFHVLVRDHKGKIAKSKFIVSK